MIPTIPDEYPLRLSTGETILVSELDSDRSPALQDGRVLKAVSGLLSHCSYISRSIAEEAKGGYDRNLKPCLRATPSGCMIKAYPYVCHLQDDCAMFSASICTLHNIHPGRHALPICWEFNLPPSGYLEPVDVQIAAVELGSVIGHAWRTGRYVLLVGVIRLPSLPVHP